MFLRAFSSPPHPLLSPHPDKDAAAIGTKLGAPVIALNAPYSYIYDVGGGKPFTLAYVMKRIPKVRHVTSRHVAVDVLRTHAIHNALPACTPR